MIHRIRGVGYLALAALFALMLPLLVACGGETAAPTQAPAAATTAPAGATTAATAAATSAPAGQATTAATRAPSPAAAGSPARAGSPAAGAAGGDDFPKGGPSSTLEPVGKKGGRIVEVSTSDAQTLNPMLNTDTSSGAIIAMLFNNLVALNPDTGLPFANLAAQVPTLENGGISKDGLTYTFKLRQNVKWHDGQPFTSKDVVFTYQTMLKRELGSIRTTELAERVESVTAPDDYTAVFKLKKVVAPFLTDSMYNIVPEHILKDVAVDKIKSDSFSTGDPSRTIGTGPFKFKEWVKDDHATVVKNPGYFLGEPALDEYIFKVVKDSTVVVAQLKTGEADYGGVQKSLFEEIGRQPNVTAIKYDAYSTTYLAFQLDPEKSPLFQDKRVRQALISAIDRESVVKAIFFGYSTVAPGTMPPPSWAYAPNQIKTKYTYDLKKAEQLLDEAGWSKGPDGIRAKDGKKLSFNLWTGPAGNKEREQYITALQQMWRAVGVEANPKTEEWNAFLSRLNDTKDFEVYLSGYALGTDPDQSTFWTCDNYKNGFNRVKYCNPRVDELMAQALVELDQNKRKQIYVEAQNILMEDLPQVFLDYPQSTVALNKRVKNMIPNAINLRWNAHTWWVTDGR